MTDAWVTRLHAEAAAARKTAADRQRDDERREAAYERDVQGFWESFAREVRARVDEFNRATPGENQVIVSSPEPNCVALKTEPPRGQFVGRLEKEERSIEVSLVGPGGVNIIHCPIEVRDDGSDRLAVRRVDRYVDIDAVVEELLGTYMKFLLGLLDQDIPRGERRIGF